jgi:hypothetical protein
VLFYTFEVIPLVEEGLNKKRNLGGDNDFELIKASVITHSISFSQNTFSVILNNVVKRTNRLSGV